MNLGNKIDLSVVPEPVPQIASHAQTISDGAKRYLDFIISLLLLLFLSPLLCAVAVCVMADSRGPAFFIQKRTGLGGVPIPVIKFRTMTVVEDGDHIRHAVRADDRVTRVGRFLRRSSIDELPQLINVVRGDMSLVGPRPHAMVHDKYYEVLVPHYGRRFRTRPGMTGLAQVNGSRGEIRTLGDMVKRVELDNAYIENWSLALDLQILIKTAVVTASQAGAY